MLRFLPLLLVACSPKDGGDGGDSGADTAADSGADTAADTGADTGDFLGPYPDGGQVYDPTDPGFVATIELVGVWSAEDGYWSAAVKTLRGGHTVDATTSEAVTIEIDGDLSVPGRYAVAEIEFVQQLSQSGDVFHYAAHAPEGLRLDVKGFADGDQLFAELDGEATLTDAVGGGTTLFSALSVRSWPKY